MPTMRKILAGTAVFILLACGLWVVSYDVKQSKNESFFSRTKSQGTESNNPPEITAPIRTKVVNRESPGPRATHAPERLKEFMLPMIAIDGLTLDGALRKLMEAYSGERVIPKAEFGPRSVHPPFANRIRSLESGNHQHRRCRFRVRVD